MKNLKVIEKLRKIVSDRPSEFQAVEDLFEMIRIYESENSKLAHVLNREIRGITAAQVKNNKNTVNLSEKFYWLHKRSLLFDALTDFDAYLQYLEFDREPEKKFYLPRRKALLPVVRALQDLDDDKLDILGISLPPGVGKAQPLYSKVLTPYGFIKMSDVEVGETVRTPDGGTAKVIGVFPQGEKEVYRVSFTDGTSCECCADHLWTVQTRDDRCNSKERTMSLKDMMKNIRVEGDKRCNYSVRRVVPMEFPKKDLFLHPYVLGIILGDGSLSGGNLSITNSEKDIIKKVEQLLPDGDTLSQSSSSEIDYRISKEDRSLSASNGARAKTQTQQALDYYGLLGGTSDDKFIPPEYLYSTVEDRLELLRGLLDSDGYTGKNCIEFTTVSPKLRDGVIEIVRSLGGRVTYITRQGSYKKGGIRRICKTYYRMVIVFPQGITPMSSEKHLGKYAPKRTDFQKYIEKVELVGKTECQCIMLDSKEGLYVTDDYIVTHNTTLAIFYLSRLMGKEPNKPNLGGSHSNAFLRGFYDEILRVFTSGEYLWSDVFPGVQVTNTNAKDMMIDLDKRKRFTSLSLRSVEAGNAGLVRAENLLYCDDLCSGIEEALSKERMDSLWQKYTVDLRQRKIGRCKELHIQTRWSVHDILGRLEREYEDNERVRFISVPALDENDESNFDYQFGVGFSTAFYHDIRSTMDDISFKALYMNQPLEREGLLYNEDDLRRYYDLPSDKPDAILAVCDTAEGGGDDTFLPVAYVYGDDYYIEDCVCDNGLPEVTDALCADMLLKHSVKQCQFESNSAGGRTADKVQEKVKEKGGVTHITKKRTTANKETKIIVNSSFVKEHFVFKDRSRYASNSSYAKMIRLLCSYTVMGKNKHDDVPDGMAQFAEYIQSLKGRAVEIIKRPF